MAEPGIIIPIKTTGVDTAVSEINKVKGASDSLTKGQLAPGASLGPRDDAGRERALRDVQALTDKAKVAEIAFYDLGAKVNAVDKPLANLGNTERGTVGGLSKTGFVANQVSMQVGDFTQQITGGTSVLRAFSQQAPQLIGTFASMGKLTGPVGLGLMAAAAVLPILTQAFTMLSASLEPVKETAQEAQTRIDDLGKALDKSITGKLTKLKADLATSEEITKNLRTDLSGLHQAENDAAKATLSNAAAMEAAEQKINVIFGIRVDQFAKIKAANDAARKARELELQAAQQADADARKKKQDNIDDLTKKRDGLKADLEKLKAENEKTAVQVADFQKRRDADLVIAKTAPVLPGLGGYMPGQDAENQRREAQAAAATAAADSAARLDENVQVGTSTISSKGKNIKELERDLKLLSSNIEGATNQLAIDQQTAETKLGTLIQTQKTSKVVELADTVGKEQQIITEKAQRLKTDLEAAAAIQGGLSPQNASALAIVTKQLENGVIDPNELQQFTTVISLVKSSREAVKNQILGSYAEVLAFDKETREAMKTMQLQHLEQIRSK